LTATGAPTSLCEIDFDEIFDEVHSALLETKKLVENTQATGYPVADVIRTVL